MSLLEVPLGVQRQKEAFEERWYEDGGREQRAASHGLVRVDLEQSFEKNDEKPKSMERKKQRQHTWMFGLC